MISAASDALLLLYLGAINPHARNRGRTHQLQTMGRDEGPSVLTVGNRPFSVLAGSIGNPPIRPAGR